VLKYHPECKKIITDDRMIERSYGRLQGKSHHQYVHSAGEHDYKVMLHWHKVDHLHGKEREGFIHKHGESDLQVVRRSYSHVPPGGESIKMVEKRVDSFIKDLLKFMAANKVNVAISVVILNI
jgi:bisphosphoglycerate-dependent phosphoglycerate mutase